MLEPGAEAHLIQKMRGPLFGLTPANHRGKANIPGRGQIRQQEIVLEAIPGAGFGGMLYGVEVPKKGVGDKFRSWIGGCYENAFSCNPNWEAAIDKLPEPPITRGVRPFAIKDEWYFNMRFAEGFDASGRKETGGVKFTRILVALPSDAVRNGPCVYPKGPYPHIQEAKGRDEALIWSVERPDGGRGFGFTGGHFHRNWQDDHFRKTILNSLCWISKVEVPNDGFHSAAVSDAELMENLASRNKR